MKIIKICQLDAAPEKQSPYATNFAERRGDLHFIQRYAYYIHKNMAEKNLTPKLSDLIRQAHETIQRAWVEFSVNGSKRQEKI